LVELHDGLETLAAAEQRRVRELLDRVPYLGVVQVPLLSDDVHNRLFAMKPSLQSVKAHGESYRGRTSPS